MKSANEFPIGVVLSLGQYHTLARDQFRGRRIRSLERCLHGQYECRTELLNDGAPGTRQVLSELSLDPEGVLTAIGAARAEKASEKHR